MSDTDLHLSIVLPTSTQGTWHTTKGTTCKNKGDNVTFSIHLTVIAPCTTSTATAHKRLHMNGAVCTMGMQHLCKLKGDMHALRVLCWPLPHAAQATNLHAQRPLLYYVQVAATNNTEGLILR